MLTFRFNGADGSMVEEETLTSGMVKKEVKLEFSHDWDDMTKTVVFSSEFVTRAVVGVSDVAVIPAEVLAKPSQLFCVGVYGVCGDGKITPTVYVMGPSIKPGTNPSYDKGTDPELPIWAQLQEEIHGIKDRDIVEGYYTPIVTQPTVNTMKISFAPRMATMPAVEPVTITLPGSGSGQNGNGLSATTSALLISILRNAVYSTDQSANITALENALFNGGTAPNVPDTPDEPDEPVIPEVILNSISAVYSGGDVEVGTAVTDLTGIVVTAHYSDGTSEPVTGYTLTGTIAEGENVITVIAGGKATTFTVTGIAKAVEYGLHQASGTAWNVSLPTTALISVLALDIKLLGGNAAGNAVLFTQSTKWGGYNGSKEWIWYNNTGYISADKTVAEIMGTRSEVSLTLDKVGDKGITLGYSSATFVKEMVWYGVKAYSSNGTLLLDAKPTVNVGEWYDSVSGTTYTASTTDGLTVEEVA